MTIKIRQRKLKDGKIRLLLDCYNKGQRKTEFLDLWIYSLPRTPKEKEYNKSTLLLVENIRAKRLLEFQDNKYGFYSNSLRSASFIKYFEKLTEERRNSTSNYGNWKSALRVLKMFTGNTEISFEEVDEVFLNKLKNYLLNTKITKSNTKLSQNSAHSYYNKFKAALNQAFEEKIIEENPAKRIKGIKQGETHRQFLTLEEINKLVKTDCESEILKQAFIFSCLTGLRWSDINNLKWSDINYSEKTNWSIQFRQQKTGGVENLPISKQAKDFLPVMDNINDRVFKGLKYSAWNNHKLSVWVLKAGINKKITYHASRHAFATLMLTHGTDIYTVSKLLGHRELKTTQIYAKIIDQKKIDAVENFPLLDVTLEE